MQNENKTNALLEKYFNRFNRYNTKVLEELGSVIKKFEGLTEEQAHALGQSLKYGRSIDDLVDELERITQMSEEDIYDVLDEVAKDNLEFSEVYYEAQNIRYVPYEDNERLINYVHSLAKETADKFSNLSNTNAIGFVLKDQNGNKIFKNLRDTYVDLIDEAVFNVSTGTVDYQSAMKSVLMQLADSGVKIHEEKVGYKSGYNRRIDSSVRQNVLTGMRQVNIGIQERIGNELGADGVELSAHSFCANDHIGIQGRQFSKKEFEKINNRLERPIGKYNCRHFIFSIILGVNLPSHSPEYLKQLNDESRAIVEYDGKKYTKYEATQVQRKLETEIRKQKDRQIIFKEADNRDEVFKAQEQISILIDKYNDFSKAAGLRTYKGRLEVVGYRKLTKR